MNRTVFGIIAALTALSAGCVEQPQPQLQPRSRPTTGPATQASRPAWRIPRGPVADAIESLGGLTAWRKVRQVSYDAVVTLYDQSGQGYVNRHQQVLDMRRWTLTTKASRPRGSWHAVVSPDGECTLKAPPDVLGSATKARLSRCLPIVKHRLTGPFNLCATRERPGDRKKMRVDGIDVMRVSIEGDRRHAVAYYFDAISGHLRFVTTGDDRPDGRGTITIYSYGRHPDGMQFPSSIRVLRIGKHVLVGQEKVLEMDVKNVRFHRGLQPAASGPATAAAANKARH